MTYENFEDLPVWNDAIKLAGDIDDLLRKMSRDQISFSKRDQLERASLSVSNNIAEGFERGTTSDLLRFLYYARGSSGETRSMLRLLLTRPYLQSFYEEINTIIDLATSCSKQLRAWAAHLQTTEIKGQRHLDSQ